MCRIKQHFPTNVFYPFSAISIEIRQLPNTRQPAIKVQVACVGIQATF
jgi:hypothetical protein